MSNDDDALIRAEVDEARREVEEVRADLGREMASRGQAEQDLVEVRDDRDRLRLALSHYADPERWRNGGYWYQSTYYEGHVFYVPEPGYLMGEPIEGSAVARDALDMPP